MELPRRAVLVVALFCASGARAQAPATPAEVTAELPGARMQGSGRLRFLGLRIYDAHWWAGAQTVAADWSAAPFALEMNYARELRGEQLAERSLSEMKRQGEIAAETAQRWLVLMKQLFPDVKTGDRITGVNLPGVGARFFVNGTLRGEPKDLDFARMFFGIWLSPRSSEPALRDALLGRAAP